MAGVASSDAIVVRDVVKQFGKGEHAFTALQNISLNIRDNEFFTLLGPSGCGKTTLLRIIAGFETVTAGEIFLFGDEIENLPANRRPVNTVFQQYALFPHMSVAQNVAFGLKRLRRPADEVRRQVAAMLELVQMSELASRRPAQLSGGQQQRVALARALAPHPKLLLLDEPLSALDLKLRQAMRVELKQIQEKTGITFIFVTHDQEEALTMSDRIAVMSAGRVQQIGTAREIYESPRNAFVANFIGETNLLPAVVAGVEEGIALCDLQAGGRLTATPTDTAASGDRGSVSVRPEHLSLTAPDTAEALNGVVDRLIYLGTDTQHLVRLDDGSELLVRTQNSQLTTAGAVAGERVGVRVHAGTAWLLVD